MPYRMAWYLRDLINCCQGGLVFHHDFTVVVNGFNSVLNEGLESKGAAGDGQHLGR